MVANFGCSATSCRPPVRNAGVCGMPATGSGIDLRLRARRAADDAQPHASLGDERIAVGQKRQAERMRQASGDDGHLHPVLLGGVERVRAGGQRDRRDADLRLPLLGDQGHGDGNEGHHTHKGTRHIEAPTRDSILRQAVHSRLNADESSRTDPRARHARSSRQRYKHFVRDYRDRRLDDRTDEASGKQSIDEGAKPDSSESRKRSQRCWAASGASTCASTCAGSGRTATRVARVFVLALIVAGLADDRAAVHAVHHRPRPAQHRARHGRRA